MDWRDIKSYEYTATHTTKDWGWEFIRRDARYHSDWKAALEKFHATPRNHVLMYTFMASDVSAYPPTDGTLNLIDPEKADTFMIPSAEAAKWGLAYYQDPSAKVMHRASFLLVKSLHIDPAYTDEHTSISLEVEPHTLVVVIDLKNPITPQLEMLAAHATVKQGEIHKANSTLIKRKGEKASQQDALRWQIYLRCLDAKACGIKRREASIELFPNDHDPQKKYSDSHQQIKEMAKNHYRRLMA